MNILYYFFTFIWGGVGALALLRAIERFAAGEGIAPVQIGLAFFFLCAAWVCLQKARAKMPEQG